MATDPTSLRQFRDNVQRALIEFLNADLDLAFTFLQTATIASDSSHSHIAIEDARTALASDCSALQGCASEDPATRRRIEHRSD